MSLFSVLLISVALAMDAMAVAVTNGIIISDLKVRHAFKVAAFFGVFQFIMPILGWLLGSSISVYFKAVDHWVAFALLSFIGVNMIIETIKSHDTKENINKPARELLSLKRLLMLAIATSIDALAVGISIALLDINIFATSLIIGIMAFILSFAGMLLGKKAGRMLGSRAELIGGFILISIGVKILIEHLFFK